MSVIYVLVAQRAPAQPVSERYIIILNRHAGAVPKGEDFGGKTEYALAGEILVTVSPAAVDALRHHPRVAYLQRVVDGAALSRGADEDPNVTAATPTAAVRLLPAVRSTLTLGNYAYDGSGNITAIGSDVYEYDLEQRLVHSATNGTSIDYKYDAPAGTYGNMTAIVVGGAQTNIAVDAATNRLASSGVQYDEAGNMTVSSAGSSRWDAGGQMLENNVGSADVQYYIYTASDERLGVRTNSDYSTPDQHWTWSLRDEAGHVLRQYRTPVSTPSAVPVWVEDYIWRDGQLLGSERPAEMGGRRHFHLDHLGTPRLVTSDSGQQVSSHAYLPFGGEQTAVAQETVGGFDREEPMKFTGHERDFRGGPGREDGNALDYMHARYYSAVWGRFLSVDPVIDFKTNLRNPQGWNRYSYVRNNPMRWTDPTGKVIAYDDEFRKRVKNDPEFRKAFEAWKQTKSGAAMWRTMAGDTNTVYKFGVGKVKEMTAPMREEEARGRTLPLVGPQNENKAGKLDMPTVSMMINADFIKYSTRLVPEMISSEIAKTIFHEGLHGLDIGSGTASAKEAWRTEDLLGKGIEPRMQIFEREFNQILPPPNFN